MRSNKYSILNLARNALTQHRDWPQAWRSPEPQPAYDVIIVGGGGHGLAAAYYLTKNHDVGRIAVLEKGWLGGGNTGRNTTIIRSNYYLDANAQFYEFSLKLWENLSQELNYNVMLSQRGVLNLAHTSAQLNAYARRGNAMRLNGIDAELLNRKQVAEMVPQLDCSPDTRFPIVGGLLQTRGGVARHDAVAWGYARAADAAGVDIIQNCKVTGICRDGNRVTGVETSHGVIGAGKVGLAVAGQAGVVAGMADLQLPIESHVLQAMVTEPVKPALNTVVTSGAAHCYVNQSDKGELVIGGDIDGYNTYARRGSPQVIADVVSAALALFPSFSRLRLMRTWAGTVDMSMDGSPIISKTPLDNLYLDVGWCYGGFKATPGAGWVFAHTIANDHPHELNTAFALDRFRTGHVLDERGSGARPWTH